jgi:rhodanese-related sulfurtransferase
METISRQELKAKLDANQDIKLVMTVGGWTFRASTSPLAELPQPRCALQTLRRDDEIIVYSTVTAVRTLGPRSDALSAHGYGNVRCYEGGLADWEHAGYPVEGTSVGFAVRRRRPHGHSP